MRGITRDSFLEMVDRKGTLIMLPAMLAGVIAVQTGDWARLQITFESNPAGSAHLAGVSEIALHFLSTYMGLLTLLVVLLAVGLFPEMLQSDRAWYYFATSLSRPRLIVEKIWSVILVYVGLLAAGVLPAVALGVIRYDLYDSRVGLIMLLHLFNAAIWLVLAAAFGMILRSSVRATLACAVLWVIQLVFVSRESIVTRLDLPYLGSLLNVVNYALPKTVELSRAADRLASGGTTDILLPIITTLLFTFLLLYSGTVAVVRRDL